MTTSVICFLSNGAGVTLDALNTQVRKAREMVTEGRYLICVFGSPDDWEKHIAIESLVITNTLGGINNRTTDWEFFGNGVIRCYTAKTLKYSKALQWTVVRRAGEKPHSRRGNFSAASLKRNAIPVADKVFTRDVANNVWHLKSDNCKERIVARFSSLLTWQDEDFLIVEGAKVTKLEDRKPLVLSDDIVGVPNKVEYFWDSGDVLF